MSQANLPTTVPTVDWSVFHLTNEFRTDGPLHLLPLLCTGADVVLWGPVFPGIRDAHSLHSSCLTPKAFLQLLEDPNGPIKVTSRAEWLLDPAYRNAYPWPDAKWVDGFDDVIKRIADEDRNKVARERRVIVAEPERGWAMAADRLARSDGGRLAASLVDLYRRGDVPAPIAQRIAVNSDRGRHPAETILRDVFNHQVARVETAANLAAVNTQYSVFYSQVQAVGVEIDIPTQFAPEDHAPTFAEAFDIMSRLAGITTEAKLVQLLCSPERRRELRRVLTSGRRLRLRANLVEQLTPFTQAELPWFRRERVLGTGVITPVITLGSVALLGISLWVGQGIGWSMLPLGFRLLQSPLEKWGGLALDLRDKDLELLFLLCYGTTRPTVGQVEAVYKELLKEIVNQTDDAGH